MTGKPSVFHCSAEKVYEAIEQFISKKGYSPSLSEIGDIVGLEKSGVSRYIRELRGMGWVSFTPGSARSLRAHRRQLAFHFAREILEPVIEISIRGVVGAGYSIEALDQDFMSFDPESTVTIRSRLIPSKIKLEELVALRVQGQSMIDSLLDDGDIIVLQRTSLADHGDMVAAWLPKSNLLTLKILKIEEKGIRLQPTNPNYPSIFFTNPNDIQVQGKVIAMERLARWY